MDDIKMDKSFYFFLVPSPKKVSNKQQLIVKLEFLYVKSHLSKVTSTTQAVSNFIKLHWDSDWKFFVPC